MRFSFISVTDTNSDAPCRKCCHVFDFFVAFVLLCLVRRAVLMNRVGLTQLTCTQSVTTVTSGTMQVSFLLVPVTA